MQAHFYKLGVRFSGPCGVCGQHTGDLEYQKDATCLYRTATGKYFPVHAECCGATVKTAVLGGARKFRHSPHDELEVSL